MCQTQTNSPLHHAVVQSVERVFEVLDKCAKPSLINMHWLVFSQCVQ